MWIVGGGFVFAVLSNVKRSWKENGARWHLEKDLWWIELAIYSDDIVCAAKTEHAKRTENVNLILLQQGVKREHEKIKQEIVNRM